MKLEFIEIDLEWTTDLSVYELKNFILSNLQEYGIPLRWAITSITSKSDDEIQIISVEAVLVMNQEKGIGILTN